LRRSPTPGGPPDGYPYETWTEDEADDFYVRDEGYVDDEHVSGLRALYTDARCDPTPNEVATP
jgi:hypothetical protein